MDPRWIGFLTGYALGVMSLPVLWFVARFVIDMLVARSRTEEAAQRSMDEVLPACAGCDGRAATDPASANCAGCRGTGVFDPSPAATAGDVNEKRADALTPTRPV